MIGTASPEAHSGIIAFELDSARKAEAIAQRLEERKIIVTKRANYFRIASHFHTPEEHIYRAIEVFTRYMTNRVSQGTLLSSKLKRPSERLATIIGATGTLGSAISELMARRKYRLLLVARDGSALNRLSQRLAKTHGVEIEAVNSDLSREDDVANLASLLASRESDFFAYTAAAAQAVTRRLPCTLRHRSTIRPLPGSAR